MLEYVSTHGAPFLSRWQIHGANRNNTDNGRAWVRVVQDGGAFTVTLFRDDARQEPVAEGTIEGDGVLELAELNDSGLSGSVRLNNGHAAEAVIDIFYACDDDILARQADVAGFLKNGNFAGREGFSEPCLRAKRVLDALITTRLGAFWIADDLQPLAEAAALYALHFIYDFLSTRDDDAAARRAKRWRFAAREALGRIDLMFGGAAERLFEPRLIRV